MKIVKIQGGLGNQMFQYAFARSLEYHGHTVFLDISPYRQQVTLNGINLYHNGFELARLFNIKYKEADISAVRKLSTIPSNFFNRIRRKYFTKKTHYIDKVFKYTPEILNSQENTYLEGYWQSENYFSDFANTLREELTFKLPLSKENKTLLANMGKNSVSIHVRRGDYLNSENLNVCTKAYYQNAIETILSLTTQNPISSFLIFSDDIEWCKENILIDGAKIVFVNHNVGNDSWQDMALMSYCNHNIIANSSFSWWGAYLNENPQKIIIAPSIWNMREIRKKDLYYHHDHSTIVPQAWLRVSILQKTINFSQSIKMNIDNTPLIFPPDPRLEKDFYTFPMLRQAQFVMLRLIKIFDLICKKYNLQYWLDAGTLLGAARHSGFIPWDDDVDVSMPFEDYQKFCSIAEKELPPDTFFQTKKTDPKHDMAWAKFRDRYSYMDDKGGPYPYNQGIPMDIFPMHIQTKRQFTFRVLYSILPPFNNPCEKPSERFSFKHNLFNVVIGIIQRIFFLFMKIPLLKKAFLHWGEKDTEKGYTYDPERPWFQFFPPETVFPLSTIKFEDTEFFAPANVEEYLTIYYGNWRSLPPENKRYGHGEKAIHLTDAGPKPDKNSLAWNQNDRNS